MSLERFGIVKSSAPAKKKSTEKKAPLKKKKEEEPPEGEELADLEEKSKLSQPSSSGTGKKKFHLKCSSAKCGFIRTVSKSTLTDDDYKCRKCGEQMKLTKTE